MSNGGGTIARNTFVDCAQPVRGPDYGWGTFDILDNEFLTDVLDNCAVVPPREVPPDVVTMYSQVLLQDTASTLRSTLTLCYPQDADPGAGLVSVLSPVGANLLGLRVGTVARWPTPAGEEREAEILALLFQPEASGDYSA